MPTKEEKLRSRQYKAARILAGQPVDKTVTPRYIESYLRGWVKAKRRDLK